MANEPVVKIEGLTELHAALKQAGEGMEKELIEELRNSSVVSMIVADAKVRFAAHVGKNLKRKPRSKGHGAQAIRSQASAKGVSIRGGKSDVPYFGWIDFGGVLKPKGRRKNTQHREVIKGGRSIYPATYAHESELSEAATAAADRMREKAGL